MAEPPRGLAERCREGIIVELTTGALLYQSQFLTTEQLAAWRDAIDREDARLLMSGLSGSMEEVWGAVKPLVPPRLGRFRTSVRARRTRDGRGCWAC
jgi:hypothetical protein